MSNTETLTEPWQDRKLTEAQQENRSSAALITVGRSGAMPMDFAQMVDYAKFMSTATGAVGAHLIRNVGACLAVMEIAKQFDMPAYAVARQSYFVNGKIAFLGSFVLAVINKYCPLKERPRWTYTGEGPTRKIIFTGHFKSEVDPRVYESPMFKDIEPKNSPLWKTEPDVQQLYRAARRWQTTNWPEGMLEVQTDWEAQEDPHHVGADNAKLIEAMDRPGAAMLERLKAAQVQTDDADEIIGVVHVREGFHPDHAHNETTMTTTNAEITSAPAGDGTELEASAGQRGDASAPASKKKKAKAAEKEPEPAKEAEPEHDVMPKSAAEWKVYCLAWIAATPAADLEKRWKEERKLRNDCGVTEAERDPVYDLILTKREA